jgi:hypothetical protein
VAEVGCNLKLAAVWKVNVKVYRLIKKEKIWERL